MPEVGDRVRFASRKVGERPRGGRRHQRHRRTAPHQVVDGGGIHRLPWARGHRRHRQDAGVIGQEGNGPGEGGKSHDVGTEDRHEGHEVIDAPVTKPIGQKK